MRFSPTQLVGAAAVVFSLAIGAAALRAHDQGALDSALVAARSARIELQHVTAQAAHADSIAASADSASRVAAAREQRALTKADSASRSLAILRERFRVAVVPDTCRPIKAAADSALAAADSVIASERAARGAADDRAAFLQVGLDTTRDALTKMRAAAVTTSRAIISVEHAAKPPFLSRFLKAAAPRIGIGFTAGLDVHGVPNAVTGLSIGWSF